MTEAAKAARLIRKDLKLAFPETIFSVITSNYSMGNSVRISWTDGPSYKQVNDLTCKYQYGHFNGMEDIYEYSNSQEFPQTKFVQCSRDLSREKKYELINIIHASGWARLHLSLDETDCIVCFDEDYVKQETGQWGSTFFNRWYHDYEEKMEKENV